MSLQLVGTIQAFMVRALQVNDETGSVDLNGNQGQVPYTPDRSSSQIPPNATKISPRHHRRQQLSRKTTETTGEPIPNRKKSLPRMPHVPQGFRRKRSSSASPILDTSPDEQSDLDFLTPDDYYFPKSWLTLSSMYIIKLKSLHSYTIVQVLEQPIAHPPKIVLYCCIDTLRISKQKKPKQKQLIQSYLSFGPRIRTCDGCQMQYSLISPEDRQLHDKHHQKWMNGIEWVRFSRSINRTRRFANRMIHLRLHNSQMDPEYWWWQ